MRRISLIIFAFAALSVPSGTLRAQNRMPTRLADVKSLYLDERSFNFSFSSCGTKAGGIIVVCPKHYSERQKFLVHLKRWLEKYGFTLVPDKDSADGIVQGTLSIDETYRRDKIPYPDEEQRRNAPRDGEAVWNVTAWAVNQGGRRIWQLGYGYPEISYGVSGNAKIEGKRLAKALEYDFRKKR